MMEVVVNVKMEFKDDKTAKNVLKKLEDAAKKNDSELSKTIKELAPIDPYDESVSIQIKNIERKKNIIIIRSHSDSIDDPPIWFGSGLAKLGSQRTLIREQWDDGGKIYYFLGKNRVPKKKYDSKQPKKPLSKKDREINEKLFLPEGRVKVKATMTEFERGEGHFGEFWEIVFMTEVGKPFIYKGMSAQLVKVTEDEYEDECEFYATFERKKINGEYVSMAKRPTKIEIKKK